MDLYMGLSYVKRAPLVWTVVLGFSMVGTALGQEVVAPAGFGISALPRPVASAVQVVEAPVIDGYLDEELWEFAPPLSGFVQADPQEGAPASEETEVRILYDDTALYIGVWLHDSDTSQIVVTDTSRDAGLGNQDSFQIIFDTFQDEQNGFAFGTNASGIQYDGQVRNQGNPSSSWDGSWEVMCQPGEGMWTAEFRIPLSTLRYGPPPQVWGLNFTRNIQRRRERTYWAPLPRQFNLSRLSSAGELGGLELPTQRSLKVLPYVVSSAARNFSSSADTDFDGDWGMDGKVSITGGLNLDLTYNTDFAQVEVDTQQINLTRFNIRFPERRPFFLENSQLFAVGASGGGFGGSGDIDLFFSRRIGLDERGNLVPIKAGARLSGKAGGYNIGVLNIQTDDVLTANGGRNPGDNFATLRVSRDLPNRSGLGAIFINRSATGQFAGSDDWNRTWGLDGRLGIGEQVSIGGVASRTETPGLAGRDYAWNMTSQYDNGKTKFNFDYGKTGEDFNPEVGYLQNTLGYKRWYFRWQETMRQEKILGWGFREFLPHVNYTRYDGLDGQGMQSADLHVDNHWDWENGIFLSAALNGSWEGLDEPFEISPGIVVPPGDHGGYRLTWRANSDRRKWLFGRHQWDVGRFLNGNQNSHTFQTIVRQGGTFALDAQWTYRSIELPAGSFKTNLARMRVTYNFTPSIFAQSLIQFNDRSQRLSMNVRFHWLWTAGTGLFVVYNDTESMEGMGPINRTFIVKYVQQFDLLPWRR